MTGASERYLRLTQVAQRAFTGGRLQRSLRLFAAAEDEKTVPLASSNASDS